MRSVNTNIIYCIALVLLLYSYVLQPCDIIQPFVDKIQENDTKFIPCGNNYKIYKKATSSDENPILIQGNQPIIERGSRLVDDILQTTKVQETNLFSFGACTEKDKEKLKYTIRDSDYFNNANTVYSWNDIYSNNPQKLPQIPVDPMDPHVSYEHSFEPLLKKPYRLKEDISVKNVHDIFRNHVVYDSKNNKSPPNFEDLKLCAQYRDKCPLGTKFDETKLTKSPFGVNHGLNPFEMDMRMADYCCDNL